MIRFLHTSDWHLGRQLYGQSLIDDQAFALERLLELIDKVQPHALLIAGDVFDRPLPPEAAVALLDRFLNETAAKRALPVFLIPGNHDSCERLGFASGLLRGKGVTIFAKIEDAYTPVKVRGDNGREALIYGIPFAEPVMIARALQKTEIETPDQALRAICRDILAKKTSSLPAILLCHAFVAGTESSESERDIFIGGSSLVGADAFDGFAYTALGHLHKPQSAGRANVRYSGSLLPYSKSEIGHAKGIAEVRLTDHSCEVEPHPLKSRRALRLIEGAIGDLLRAAANDPSREDYVIAVSTDQGAVLDSFGKLHAFYPNLLHVARASGFQPSNQPAWAKSKAPEGIGELELFAEFFQSVTGDAMNPKERAELIAAIAELERGEASP